MSTDPTTSIPPAPAARAPCEERLGVLVLSGADPDGGGPLWPRELERCLAGQWVSLWRGTDVGDHGRSAGGPAPRVEVECLWTLALIDSSLAGSERLAGLLAARPEGRVWVIIEALAQPPISLVPHPRLEIVSAGELVGRLLREVARRGLPQPLPPSALPEPPWREALDPLTRLPGRARLLADLTVLLGRPPGMTGRGRRGVGVSLFVLDIDRFRSVNEGFGTAQGDAVLVQTARRLRELVRDEAWVYRLGSDELAVLFQRPLSPALLATLAARLVRLPPSRIDSEERSLLLSSSVGAASATLAEGLSADDLLRRVGFALSQAKRRGGARAVLFDPEAHAVGFLEQRLRTEVLEDLRSGRFRLVLQPIVALDSGRQVGFEQLLRWRHSALGELSPGLFVPLLERDGLIGAVGDWIIEESCRTWRQLAELADPGSRTGLLPLLTLNVSCRQLVSCDFARRTARILRDHGVADGALGLEVTETVLAEDTEAVRENLARLRREGVQVLIDDFGVGYSSLSGLHQLPVDIIKLDMRFVHGATASRKGRVLVEKVVELCHALELGVVAEGIETAEQLHCMRSLGCAFGQGFLLGRPMERQAVVEGWTGPRGPPCAEDGSAVAPPHLLSEDQCL